MNIDLLETLETQLFQRHKLTVYIGLMAIGQSMAAQAEMAKNITAGALETVIVVGEKRNRDLQETLSSVSVTTAADIEEKGYFTIQDVYADTAGVYPDAGGLGFAMRGIPFEGLGGNRSSSDVVTVYIDGVPQTNSSVNFRPMQLWDVEQVEIYRGAQSTVQGRNALAGAVIINTQRPEYQSSAKFRALAGDYGTLGGSAAVGGAIEEGVAAWRLSVDHLSSDGYIENETLDIDANETAFDTINAKVLLEPSEFTEVVVVGTHSKARHGELSNNTARADAFDYVLFQNTEAFRKNEVSSLAAHIQHDVGDAWQLTSVTTYSDTRDDSLLDWDQVETERPDTIAVDRDQDTVTQELRFNYNGSNLNGNLGVYYFSARQDATSTAALSAADALGSPALLDFYDDGFRLAVSSETETEIENYALFGELEWRLSDRLRLIAGARHDRETNDTDSVTHAAALTGFNGSPVDATLEAVIASQAVPANKTEASYNAFLPKAAIMYSISDQVSVGFTAQRGYRAGGTVLNQATGENVEYDPEYTDNYEITLRSQWPRAGLTLNGNIYYIDWTDQQVTVLTDPTNSFSGQIENAGESHLTGIELSLRYAIDNRWEIYASSAFNKSEYDEFTSSRSDLTGQTFEGAPETIVNLGLRYRHEGGFGVNLNTRYQSDNVAQYVVANGIVSGERENDAYTLVDLTLSYSAGPWLFSAQVNNAFDEEYITNNQNDFFVDVGAPRTVLVSTQYQF